MSSHIEVITEYAPRNNHIANKGVKIVSQRRGQHYPMKQNVFNLYIGPSLAKVKIIKVKDGHNCGGSLAIYY